MIVATTAGGEQHAAPPSEMSPKACLDILDSLASSLEDRSNLKNKFDELQQYQADPTTAKEVLSLLVKFAKIEIYTTCQLFGSDRLLCF